MLSLSRFLSASALVISALGGLACAPPASAERPVTVNQEPVAALVLPGEAQALVEVTATLSGTDVDGALTHATLAWGDDTILDVELPHGGLPPEGLSLSHAYASAGLYDVELAVSDDGGLVGRARTRLLVAPPPDASPPTIASLAVTFDGAPLAGGARVPVGAIIDASVHANDADGHLESALIAAVSETGGVEAAVALAGADATGTATLALATVGDVVIEARALDSFGNASAPATLALTVLALDADSDGDGLVDVDDAEPGVFNGLSAALFTIETIAEDLLGNQRAETVVEALATPLAEFPVAAVALSVASSSSPLSSLPDHEGELSELFAVRYRGLLIAPPGADHVIVEVAADDVGVVFIDGVAVASADREYAEDFLRFDRAPAESEPVALPAGGRVPLTIVVANGSGPWAWTVRFRFLAGDTTIMNPEAVSQRQFSVQE